MPVTLHQLLRRLSAVVVVFCYVWLSAAGAFLHQCVPVHTSPQNALSGAVRVASVQALDGTHLSEHAHVNSANSCAVCEWQSVNLSVALPAIEIVPPFSRQQRVITTLPRYLRTVVVSASSRAPPLALP